MQQNHLNNVDCWQTTKWKISDLLAIHPDGFITHPQIETLKHQHKQQFNAQISD
jgi:hypothetical protein